MAGLAHVALRAFAAFNSFMVFVSAVIVTGLMSYLLSRFSNRDVHLVYTEVIAVITLTFYMLAMILPLIPFYTGLLAPMHLIFTYLWLTAFIFASQDWSHHRCRNSLPAPGLCPRKHGIEAFTFIAFFFLLCNVVVESLLWRAHRRAASTELRTKERPHSGTTGSTTTA